MEDHMRMQETYDLAKSNARRIGVLEEGQVQLHELVTSVALLAQKMGDMEKSVGNIQTDLRSVMDKPGKRWEAVVEKVVLVLVGAVAAAIASGIGF